MSIQIISPLLLFFVFLLTTPKEIQKRVYFFFWQKIGDNLVEMKCQRMPIMIRIINIIITILVIIICDSNHSHWRGRDMDRKVVGEEEEDEEE